MKLLSLIILLQLPVLNKQVFITECMKICEGVTEINTGFAASIPDIVRSPLK